MKKILAILAILCVPAIAVADISEAPEPTPEVTATPTPESTPEPTVSPTTEPEPDNEVIPPKPVKTPYSRVYNDEKGNTLYEGSRGENTVNRDTPRERSGTPYVISK